MLFLICTPESSAVARLYLRWLNALYASPHPATEDKYIIKENHKTGVTPARYPL